MHRTTLSPSGHFRSGLGGRGTKWEEEKFNMYSMASENSHYCLCFKTCPVRNPVDTWQWWTDEKGELCHRVQFVLIKNPSTSLSQQRRPLLTVYFSVLLSRFSHCWILLCSRSLQYPPSRFPSAQLYLGNKSDFFLLPASRVPIRSDAGQFCCFYAAAAPTAAGHSYPSHGQLFIVPLPISTL